MVHGVDVLMFDSSSSSYGSASADPFGDRFTRIEDFYEESDLPPGHLAKTTKKVHRAFDQDSQRTCRHKEMSQSLSEGNIDFRSYRVQFPAVQVNHTRLASDEIPIRYSEETPVSSSSSRGAASSLSSRGRSVLRSPSPSKLEDIKEASLSSEKLLKTPPKRSRSPMKQLFGEHGWLGRSMSMSELPNEEYHKKTGLKQWGGKLKERVEHLVSSARNA